MRMLAWRRTASSTSCRMLWTRTCETAGLRPVERDHELCRLVEDKLSRREVDEALKAAFRLRDEGLFPSEKLVRGWTDRLLELNRLDATVRLVRREGMPIDSTRLREVIGACATAGRVDESLWLLEGMRRSGLVADAGCYLTALSACADNGAWQEAVHLHAKLREAGHVVGWNTVALVARAFSCGGQADQALKVVDRAARELRTPPETCVHSAILQGCIDAGEEGWKARLELLRAMRERRFWGAVPSACESEMAMTHLLACQREGRADEAAEILRGVDRAEPQHISAAVKTYVLAGRPEDAEKAVMDAVAKEGRPDVQVFVHLVQGYVKAGTWEAAVRLLEDDTNSRVSPILQDPHLYDTAMRECINARAYRAVSSLWVLMEKRRVEPEGSTLGYVMQAFIRSGRWRDAVNIAKTLARGAMEGTPGLGATFNDAVLLGMTACTRKGDWAALIDLVESVRSLGCPVDHRLSNLLTHGMRTCVSTRRYQQAVDLFGALKTLTPPDVDASNAAIEAYAELQTPEAALGVLDGMLDSGVAPTELTFTKLIIACGNAGQWEKAVALLQSMQANGMAITETAYSAAVDACLRAGQLDEVVALSAELQRLTTATPAASITASSASSPTPGVESSPMATIDDAPPAVPSTPTAASTAVASAPAAFEEEWVKPDEMVLEQLSERNDWKTAVDVLHKMKANGMEPSANAVAVAMETCRKAGQPHEAIRLSEAMQQESSCPDEATYAEAVAACIDTGDFDKATELIDQMQLRRVPVRRAVYESLVEGFREAGRWKEAIEVLEKMQKAGHEITKEAYAAVMSVWMRAGQLDEMLSVLRTVRRFRPHVIVYESTAKVCREAGRWDTALYLLRLMGNVKLKPTEPIYNELIDACQAAGKLGELIDVFLALEARGLRTPGAVWEKVALAASRTGYAAEALRALGHIVTSTVTKASYPFYGRVMNECAEIGEHRGGGWRNVVVTLEKLEAGDIAEAQKRLVRQLLLWVLSRSGEKGKLLDDMLQPQESEDSDIGLEGKQYLHAIDALARASRFDDAMKLVEEAEGKGDWTRPKIVKTAIRGMDSVGLSSAVVGLAHAATAAGVLIREDTWEVVAKALVDDPKKMLWLVQTMAASKMRPPSEHVRDCAVKVVKEGGWEAAAELLDAATDAMNDRDRYTYFQVLHKVLDAGWSRKKFEQYVRMMESRGVKPNKKAWGVGLIAASKAGDHAQALRLLQETERMNIHDDDLNVVHYTAVINACERAGDWRQCMDLLTAMRKKSITPNAVTYGQVMDALTKAGQVEGAAGLLMRMHKAGDKPNVTMYNKVMYACGKAKRFKEARVVLDVMMQHGVKPDSWTFNSALRAAPDHKSMLPLLHQMRELGVNADNHTIRAIKDLRAETPEELEAVTKAYSLARQSEHPPDRARSRSRSSVDARVRMAA